MDSNFRQKDTLKIFEERYKVNKESYSKLQENKEKQKEFTTKLFNSDMSGQQRINDNVNNLRQAQRDLFRNKF